MITWWAVSVFLAIALAASPTTVPVPVEESEANYLPSDVTEDPSDYELEFLSDQNNEDYMDEDEDEADDLDTLDEVQADVGDPYVGTQRKIDSFWKTYRTTLTTVRPIGHRVDPKLMEKFNEHYRKVSVEAKCKVPRATVVRVAEHHMSTTKTYFPSCTIVHQCSEMTGCCGHHHRCGPKKIDKIELIFTVLTEAPAIGSHHKRKTKTIEYLTFYNHTECECQPRTDEMPRDVQPTPDPSDPFKMCKCPSPFTRRILPGGECGCDCFDQQKDCMKYKKGKDYMLFADRLCILRRNCLIPICAYGNYSTYFDRCPRRDEKFRF